MLCYDVKALKCEIPVLCGQPDQLKNNQGLGWEWGGDWQIACTKENCDQGQRQ
jgi:hypothetical protein